MKKIRIGNEIRVRDILNELGSWNQTNIKQLRCYFIRLDDEHDEDNFSRKQPTYYEPTLYSMNCCGCPTYNIYPYNSNACALQAFGTFTDPHWFPGYNGFGVCSTPFKHVPREFLAPVRVLAELNKFEAYFPAESQLMLGDYKVVFVISLYEEGWGLNNLRTFSIDKGVLFTLVADGSGSDSSVEIDLGEEVKYKVTLSGEQIDYDLTTLPTEVTEGSGLKGRVYVKSGYNISSIKTTMGAQIKEKPVEDGSKYIDIDVPSVNNDVTIVITVVAQQTDFAVIINGDNIDKDATTLPNHVAPNGSIDGYIFVTNKYTIKNVTFIMGGVLQQYSFTLGKEYTRVTIPKVTGTVVIGISSLAKPI